VRRALRYLSLLGVQLRASLVFALQYRADFALDGAVEVVWAASAVAPLFVVLSGGRTVGGWPLAEALVVVACFTLLKAVLDGAVSPSIGAVVEHVRKGTLDFVLLKPADAQFLVSTARFLPWRAVNVLTALLLLGLAFRALGRLPSAVDVLAGALLLADAVVLLYALLVITVSVAFYAVRVDNLTFLLSSVFDAARWPGSVFRGAMRVVFTFVLPLIVMTTYPAEAILGRARAGMLLGATAGAAAFTLLARLTWLRSIRAYTSASS